MTENAGGIALSESVENYLETILEIEAQQSAPVRSVDIAAHLHVSRASVSKAMHLLREAGMVEFGHYGQVSLSPAGRQAAAEVLETAPDAEKVPDRGTRCRGIRRGRRGVPDGTRDRQRNQA